MKIVLDLALKSDIGLLIGDRFFSISRVLYQFPYKENGKTIDFDGKTTEVIIPENEVLDSIKRIMVDYCRSIRENFINTECYIELPLFANTKEWSIFYGKVESLLQQLGFKNIYRIDVGVWRNEAARRLGYESDKDFMSRMRYKMKEDTYITYIVNNEYYLPEYWFTKGFRTSKILPMVYCLEKKLTSDKISLSSPTEDEFDCRCIAHVVNPSMNNQTIKENKREEKSERRKSIMSKAKEIRVAQVSKKKDEIKVLKQKLSLIKEILKGYSKKTWRKDKLPSWETFDILIEDIRKVGEQ